MVRLVSQSQMPILDAMNRYKNQQPIRFHVPGHKGKTENAFFSSIFPHDVTEITGLDDLHQAEEAIFEAQRLAAEVFRSDETFFLVGGSTAGNIAMILACARPGDSALIQRNVHKSVIHGLILARVKPIYLPPTFDEQTGLALSASLSELERKLKEERPRFVFISNPNYFGMTVDLAPYARLCRKYGVALLVDEAHGAHFGQAEHVPPSAMQAGASASVQSTHKMLPALTMSSMLHIQGDMIDRNKLRQALTIVQSSSPSYPLMASLDYARHYVYHYGKEDFARAIHSIEQFYIKAKERDFRWLRFAARGASYDYLDPFKITLRSRSRSFHGFALKAFLEDNGIYPELADEQNVLLALSPFTEERELDALLDVLSKVDLVEVNENAIIPTYTFAQEVVLLPSEVVHSAAERIPLKDAVGRVSAEMITPYPPGVPVVNPGERIDSSTLGYLLELRRIGCRFHDISDRTLETLLVVERE